MIYRLKIIYDGSYFSGYAKQANSIITVQSELENKLSHLFGFAIKTTASSRTDKYVHALDQNISFVINQNILSCEIIQNFLNKNLPHIYVKKVDNPSSNFHVRYSVKSKTYLYIINSGPFNLFKENYEFQYNKPLDIKKAEVILNLFVGKKNFLSFSTSDLKETTRTINWIKIVKKQKKFFIFINGQGFLRNMVRMIVATIISFCEDKLSYQKIISYFDNPQKGICINKVPGCGLYLYETLY